MNNDTGITDTPTATTEAELARLIGYARDRWERYVNDCNPVQELDQHGRSLNQALAHRVLSVPQVAAGLELLEAIENMSEPEYAPPAPAGLPTVVVYAWDSGWTEGHNELLARLRVIAGINDTKVRP